MNMIGGIIGGILGGLIGAAIWAGITFATGYEIGWIAWGVGGLVGLGCSWGSRGADTLLGGSATLITLLAILGGKYAAVELSIRKEVGSETEAVQNALAELQNEEIVISYVADGIIAARVARGDTIEWPSGVTPEEASQQSDYPPAVWSQAASEWEQMPAKDQETFREAIAEQVRQNISSFYDEVSNTGFMQSFSVMDLLFFFLAVTTAFRLATRGTSTASESDTDEEVA